MASFFTEFHFIRPWWLLALPVGLILLSSLKRQDAGISQWHKVCDQHLLEKLLVGESVSGRKRVYGALLTMLLLITLALAGPTWERLPQPLFRAAAGRVIVLDLSLSMMTEDITPSRLTRARYRAVDLIKSGKGIEQGLVVFAGDAFIVTPLTDDRATLLNLLPSLDTSTVPVQGSRADRGLKKAGELLNRALIKHGQIILISDDADPQTVTMARKIKQAGHRIDVIAVGTATGAPIALPDGGYLKDSRGQIVVPVPDFSSLKKVAANSGGSYLKIDASESAFQRLNRFPTHFPENLQNRKVTGDQWLDRGPWLLIPLLLLAALSFRKGWILLILLALLLPPEKAAAFSWQDLWQRPAQQAADAFKTNDYDKAAGLSKDPDWQAAALYRAGKFKEAATALKSQESSLSHYNRGNALARSGDLQEALTAYEKALAIDPGLEDASFNRDLVKELMQQQEQQKKEQQQQNSDDQQKSEDSDKSESQEKNSDSQDSEKQQSDSQESDSEKNESSDSASKQQKSQEKDQSQNRQDAEPQSDQEEKANNDSQTQATEKSNPEKKSEPQSSAKPDKREQPETAGQEESAAAASENDEKPLDAEQQALKQWLRRIPDDPGGLLKRKFLYQYRDRQDRSQGSKEW